MQIHGIWIRRSQVRVRTKRIQTEIDVPKIDPSLAAKKDGSFVEAGQLGSRRRERFEPQSRTESFRHLS